VGFLGLRSAIPPSLDRLRAIAHISKSIDPAGSPC
jgi:hypothetical protein